MAKKRQYSIGYVYYKTYYDKTNDRIMKALKNIDLNVVLLPVEDQIELEILKERTKDCQVILNNAVFGPIEFESIELSKTLEELGKTVVNSSHSFFYEDDRWLFYLTCLNHNLPTPKTYFIPKERQYDSREIKHILTERPLIVKAIFSDNCESVYKAKDYHSFLKKLHTIIKKNPASPIIAQEFIPNNNRSYRATLIGCKLVQFVEKIGKSWKQSGNNPVEHFRTIKIDPKLKKLCEKATKIFGMDVCGLDLLQRDKNWFIIEANSCPALDFIYADEKRLVTLLADYLFKLCKKS